MNSEKPAAGTRLKTAESPDKQQGTSVFVELEVFLKPMLMLHLRLDGDSSKLAECFIKARIATAHSWEEETLSMSGSDILPRCLWDLQNCKVYMPCSLKSTSQHQKLAWL